MNVIEKYFVNVLGNGTETILFAHGYGCNQSMWRYVVPEFEKTHKIVLYDLMGCGNSKTEYYDYQKYSSLNGHAQDVLDIIEELKLPPVIFVGHSVSAMIGLLACNKKPEKFSHLVMVCPNPYFINEPGSSYTGGFSEQDLKEISESLDSNYLGWTSYITPVIAGTPDKPEVAEELKNSFCRNDPEIAKHFAKITFGSDLRAELPYCKVKTLVVQTVPDALAPVSVGEYVHKQISNSTLKILHTPGHAPHLSDPMKLIEVMTEFLSS